MNKLTKPISCTEKWSNMTPTEGGWICQSCSKTIIDFINKSWKQIEDLQSDNDNKLCGIYKTKQLNNWGKEIESKPSILRKTAALAIISTALSATLNAQTGTKLEDFITIYGTVLSDVYSQSERSTTKKPVEGALIKIEYFNIQTSSDRLGNYSISIPKNQLNNEIIEMVTSSPNYGKQSVEIQTSKAKNDSIHSNQNLKPIPIEISVPYTIFYAQPPTLTETIIEKVGVKKRRKQKRRPKWATNYIPNSAFQHEQSFDNEQFHIL